MLWSLWNKVLFDGNTSSNNASAIGTVSAGTVNLINCTFVNNTGSDWWGRAIYAETEITIKYSGYIEKEKNNVDKMNKLEDIIIPDNFDYSKLHSVSTEGKEKLKEVSPRTIGQASRISGVSPSDINILLIYIGR